MMKLEDLTKGATIRGILTNQVVTVVDVKWFGSDAVELTYKYANGRPGRDLLYRDREETLEIVTSDRPWSFNADGSLLRLVSEAHRIRLAHLFNEAEEP